MDETLIYKCKQNCLQMTQVQLRLAEGTVKQIDEWVKDGRFKNRSDAIKNILKLYEEREKTREFYNLLMKLSKDADEHPEKFVPMEDVKWDMD